MGACCGKPTAKPVTLLESDAPKQAPAADAAETKQAPVSDAAPVDNSAGAPPDAPVDNTAGAADNAAGAAATPPAVAPAVDATPVDTSAGAPADASASAPTSTPADAPPVDPPAPATDVAPANEQESTKTDAVAAAEGDSVPEEVVRAAMKVMEDKYNANDMDGAAAIYAPECLVTVNGGVDAGGPFTGKTPQECAQFLGNLRNTMGGTNISFSVTKVDGFVHQDTWTADNGTGSCKATWKLIDGTWLIKADEISFTAAKEVQETTAPDPKSGSCFSLC